MSTSTTWKTCLGLALSRRGLAALGLVLAILAANSLVSPRPAAAGSFEAQLCTGLISTLAGSRGYRVRATDTDSLREGYYSQYTFTLYRGYQYAIAACGDSSVRDLDIYIYDENGNLIDQDRMRDAQPIVEVAPRWTGSFRVRVVMYDSVGNGRGIYSLALLYR